MRPIKKITLTIGIPAFNEEKNITRLVESLYKQKSQRYDIEKIIVVSDASTDNTVPYLKKLNKQNLTIIQNDARQGKSLCLSRIVKLCQSDLLLLLDADVMIKQNKFIEKMLEPVLINQADLVSARIEEIKSPGYFEKILAESMRFKKNIFESLRQGDNIYTCHGRALLLSRRLYKKINYKGNPLADDAYSYLICIKNSFKYHYQKKAHIYYRLPGNLSDHEKQSRRFIQSQQQLNKLFTPSLVDQCYSLPKISVLKAIANSFLANPLAVIYYLAILIYVKISAKKKAPIKSQWAPAGSSKLLKI